MMKKRIIFWGLFVFCVIAILLMGKDWIIEQSFRYTLHIRIDSANKRQLEQKLLFEQGSNEIVYNDKGEVTVFKVNQCFYEVFDKDFKYQIRKQDGDYIAYATYSSTLYVKPIGKSYQWEKTSKSTVEVYFKLKQFIWHEIDRKDYLLME